MKKYLFAVAALILVAAAIFGREPLLQKLMAHQIDRTLTRVDDSMLSDGKLHVVLCGTAAALPDKDRAGPCTAVIAGGQFLLVDAGPGSWRNVDLLNLPTAKLSGILVTHFHSDHIGDIGEAITQSWIAGRKEPLPIYGPPGVLDIVEGFRQAYARDAGYRVAHHDEEYMPSAGSRTRAQTISMPTGEDATSVFERDGLKVSAFRVDHAPVEPAMGYRFEYAGRVVVISGDTVPTASVVRNAQGADLLLHEALAAHLTDRAAKRADDLGMLRLGKLARDVRGYHTTPVQAAEIAQQAGVHTLVYTHIFPPLTNAVARRLFLKGTGKAFDGEIVLGEDGSRFDLAPKAP
jgi:ribonuclease Z